MIRPMFSSASSSLGADGGSRCRSRSGILDSSRHLIQENLLRMPGLMMTNLSRRSDRNPLGCAVACNTHSIRTHSNRDRTSLDVFEPADPDRQSRPASHGPELRYRRCIISQNRSVCRNIKWVSSACFPNGLPASGSSTVFEAGVPDPVGRRLSTPR